MKYEYKHVEWLGYAVDNDYLNELGNDGWELVNFIMIPSKLDHIPEPTFHLIFKRSKHETT